MNIKKSIQKRINRFKLKSQAFIMNKKMNKDIKQGKIPVVIDCELETLNQFVEPIVDELVKNKDYNFEFYFGEAILGYGKSFSTYKKCNCFSNSLYNDIEYAKLFLSPHIYPKGPQKALKIIIDHGICSAKFSHHPKELYEQYDVYLVTGEINKMKIEAIIKNYGLENKIKILNTGYPKFDKLFSHELPTQQELLKELGLDENKKTIIYAPSWEEGLSMRGFSEELIETIVSENKYNLIIKPHPTNLVDKKDENFDFYTGGILWREKLEKFNKEPDCIFINKYNNDNLLIAADIMITDLSSIALEFLALDKPIIYLDCPNFEKTFNTVYKTFNNCTYKELLENPLCNAGRHVGLVNYDYKKIVEDIDLLISNPDYKMEERKSFSSQLLSNKGVSAKETARQFLKIYKEIN